MSKKYMIIGGLVGMVLLAWVVLGSETSEEKNIYVTPVRGPFTVDVTTSGELRAKNSTNIRGPEGMREIRIFNTNIQTLIPEGTVVEKGEFVAELDRSEVLSQLQDARLELQKVQSQFEQAQLDSSLTLSQARDDLINMEYTVEERKITLEQSKYESPAVQRQAEIDYERAQRQYRQATKNYSTKVKQAEAKLREIQAELEKKKRDTQKIQQIMSEFTIKAPEKGMVIYRRTRNGSKITEGSSVSAWNPIVAELPDFSIMESVTYVNEVDIQKVKKGQEVNVGLDADPDKNLKGVITEVANIGEQRPNSDSKVFQVIIRINDSDTTLRPAMTTSNQIKINSIDDALQIPLETVHTSDSLNFVFVREGLASTMKQVILGAMNENSVVIKEGLGLDDQLYLSTPQDTSGINKVLLPEKVVQKYRETEPEKTDKSTQMETLRGNMEASPNRKKMQRQNSGQQPGS